MLFGVTSVCRRVELDQPTRSGWTVREATLDKVNCRDRGKWSRYDHPPCTGSTFTSSCPRNDRSRPLCGRSDRRVRHAQHRSSDVAQGERTQPPIRPIPREHECRSSGAERRLDRSGERNDRSLRECTDHHHVVLPALEKFPLPILSPTTAGSWRTNGATLTFTPSTDLAPLGEIAITVPGGPAGVVGSGGGQLSQSVIEQFRVANGSVVRLQELLSLLGYSPLAWTPTGAPIEPSNTGAQLAALYNPPSGRYSWRDDGWPARLRAMWQPGIDNTFTRGLIMSFQADHGLVPNGDVEAGVWTSLIDALAANTVNTGGYNYALADKADPQSLTIYHDGASSFAVSRTPASPGLRRPTARSPSTRVFGDRSCEARTRTGGAMRTWCSTSRTSTATTRCTTWIAPTTASAEPRLRRAAAR